LFVDWFLIPDTAILDPDLTVGLPPKLTAATGMDALTHAVESLHSLQRQPIADALALHAIRLVREYLPVAVENGKDIVARGQMLIAATLAGCAFSNAQVGLVHAMAHTAGARFGIHHGHANSIFLPHVIRYNGDVCADRYRLVAEAMGVDTRAMDDEAAVEAAARACAELAARCGLSGRLRDVGVAESALTDDLAEATTYDGAIVYNPKFVGEAASLIPVYKAAW
jgi:alcohol dehydrogenase